MTQIPLRLTGWVLDDEKGDLIASFVKAPPEDDHDPVNYLPDEAFEIAIKYAGKKLKHLDRPDWYWKLRGEDPPWTPVPDEDSDVTGAQEPAQAAGTPIYTQLLNELE